MSDWLEALILGIIQGLTEFLPVSSSGHLELAKYILGYDSLPEESLLMTVCLHAATAVATIIVFRREVIHIIRGLFKGWNDPAWAYSVKIIISMIPAALVGLYWNELVESLFSGRIVLVGAMLLVTALLLYLADLAKTTDKPVAYMTALYIGLAQAVAIIPGISRSGATIATALLLGVQREEAARFSFLMVVPLIIGKMADELMDGQLSSTQEGNISLVIGFLAALVSGIWACKVMVRIVKRSNLKYFAVYCALVGLIFIILKAL